MACSSFRSFQQWVELALALQGMEIVAAADVALADPDLRHGAAAAGLLRHLGAQLGLQVDADLLDLRAFRQQQALGRLAERARRGGVHQHTGLAQGPVLYFSTGKPACCQAPMPPLRFTTLAKPCFLRAPMAFAARLVPVSQYTMSGRSLRLARSFAPSSRRASGTFFAPRICPAPYSPGSRTSTTSA